MLEACVARQTRDDGGGGRPPGGVAAVEAVEVQDPEVLAEARDIAGDVGDGILHGVTCADWLLLALRWP